MEGYQAEGAADGVQALDILHKGRFRPDVILLDLYMPTMNGQSSARRCRPRPAGSTSRSSSAPARSPRRPSRAPSRHWRARRRRCASRRRPSRLRGPGAEGPRPDRLALLPGGQRGSGRRRQRTRPRRACAPASPRPGRPRRGPCRDGRAAIHGDHVGGRNHERPEQREGAADALHGDPLPVDLPMFVESSVQVTSPIPPSPLTAAASLASTT